ncbi:Uncharacterized SAM-binding protein YcdF, DUF218 family [Reichenbachiella faecimaris]|uniref:Uncharacterized SAM-binding protein YcdF, DUF218 family n=1 Tax=Reichenbachiella faecimaris TaxID=692418 RepID=A0A1W2GNF5_REIFA|nr:YdcF family protein [Reichenbachiella faecimaris]SMD37796.1 Uncharacterized SAM-binding protein YcdF, DUF218 family [Reichenbachiella faecimaris]
MFFVLSKIVYWLVMPTSLIAWLVIASILIRKSKLKRASRILAISLFFVFTNPLITTLVINVWEPDPIPYHEVNETYRFGVVLSGITNPNRPPFDRVQFNKGADRIVHAIDLYRLGVIEKILITGGSGTLTFEGKKESHALREFAMNCGVAQEDLLIEDQARNTRENALFAAEIIDNSNQALLITSAFHMYRAEKCFQKVGFDIKPFPTDHYGNMLHYTPDEVLMPSVHSLQIWTTLTKEWIGTVAYSAAGYI